jgi:hypothetical protein
VKAWPLGAAGSVSELGARQEPKPSIGRCGMLTLEVR